MSWLRARFRRRLRPVAEHQKALCADTVGQRCAPLPVIAAVLRPSGFMGALGGIGILGARRRKRGGKGQAERHVSALRDLSEVCQSLLAFHYVLRAPRRSGSTDTENGRSRPTKIGRSTCD